MQYVPVRDSEDKPLMPCHPARARELVRKGEAVRRFDGGLFFIKLIKRIGGVIQTVACGIDPGIKKEGFTVKSAKHTFLNVQADAVTWVKDAVETRASMRRSRRGRNTPCRPPRFDNRTKAKLLPSIKARWQWKLRLARWLSRNFPIAMFRVEDLKAKTKKGQRKWNSCFSPLEVGKEFFYGELEKVANYKLVGGWQTKEWRDALGLKKSSNKLSDSFNSHCVDSWVMARMEVGGDAPDNTSVLCVKPIRLHRRQLHRMEASKGGVRRRYGSTRSLGLKRGSLALHIKKGLCTIGGFAKGLISIHSAEDGKRICQNADPKDLIILKLNSFYSRLASSTGTSPVVSASPIV